MTLPQQETIITESISNTTIAQWSYYYTHGKHLAGTNKSMAEWTRDKWIEYGIPSHLVEYEVYLNYPVSHSLSLAIDGEEEFVAGLSEDVLPEDPTTGAKDRVPSVANAVKSAVMERCFIEPPCAGGSAMTTPLEGETRTPLEQKSRRVSPVTLNAAQGQVVDYLSRVAVTRCQDTMTRKVLLVTSRIGCLLK